MQARMNIFVPLVSEFRAPLHPSWALGGWDHEPVIHRLQSWSAGGGLAIPQTRGAGPASPPPALTAALTSASRKANNFVNESN